MSDLNKLEKPDRSRHNWTEGVMRECLCGQWRMTVLIDGEPTCASCCDESHLQYWKNFSQELTDRLEASQQRIAQLEAEAEREDEITIDALASMREWRLRADTAEAELSRRDAAAGEPDYYIHRVEFCDSYGPDVELRAFNNALDASKCKGDHGGEVFKVFATPPAPSAPDGLSAAVNRLLDSDGSRGTFSAIRRSDALEEVECLLAAAPAPGDS